MVRGILTSIILVFASLQAGAQQKNVFTGGCVDCFNFVAPSIMGAENINPAEIGLIVYDSSFGYFRGYNDEGKWSKMSDERSLSSVTATSSVAVTTDMVLANATSGAITLTLPSAALLPGKEIIIKKTNSGANLVTIDGYSTETIDGEAAISLVSKNAFVELVSDGTNFVIKNFQDNWRVDANIAGTNPSLGTSNVSSYTGIENGSLTLTNRTTNNGLAAQIPCSSTNAPSGTTCSSGSESVGVSFTLPAAGDVLACASFAQYVGISAASGSPAIHDTFQIIETPNNAQTISQEGNSRIGSSVRSQMTSGNQAFGGIAARVCGTFVFSSAGQKTLRLMYEQLVSDSPSATNEIVADSGGSTGQREIHWEVYPLR